MGVQDKVISSHFIRGGMEVRTIGGREVTLRSGSDTCLITFYADFDENMVDDLFSRIPDVSIADVRVRDWNSELSPWDAPPVFGKEGFGHGAQEFLDYILESLLPELGARRYIIGGYSLAGLFSLWACYRTDAFIGCAAASPSVWFPGWDGFIQGNRMNAQRVYLSLGDRESRTRNQAVGTVADRIRLQHDVLQEQLGPENTLIEWNPGNHFVDFPERMAKAFRWTAGV